MKTTYEIDGSATYRADPARGGDITLTIREGNTIVRATLIESEALGLKRNLARLVDANVADPNEGGYSIAELVKIRKVFDEGGIVDDDELAEIISAYIRLIERVEQASVVNP